MKTRLIFAVTMTALTLVAQSGPALAYLDPGTSSIILQMLLGGVAGGLVVMKLYWARIKGWVSPRAAAAAAPAATDDDKKAPDDA